MIGFGVLFNISLITLGGTSSFNPISIVSAVWASYIRSTPQRTTLIDVFLCYLMVTWVLQFVYCVIAGNYVCNWTSKTNISLHLVCCLRCGWIE